MGMGKHGWSALIDKEQKQEMKQDEQQRLSTAAAAAWIVKDKLAFDNMRGIVVHQVHPKVAACGDYVEYVCVMENSRSGMTWEVKRRYSLFLDLREDLDELFETPHCHYCKQAVAKMQALVFPPKRIFHTDEIILQRVAEFQAYIEAILKIVSNSFFRNCPLVREQANTLIKRFLTKGMRRHNMILSKENATFSVPILLRELQHHDVRSPKLTLEPIFELPPLAMAKAC
ncbi:Aste57867_17668 [Aphanomyces stellatus]|uniref:Aste57867_17668 protein n=1 Tax=Aphanomyces stellatus TaxID=120398 RepID=A0A485L8Y1_9STRA|nr:hypothetical protein As57867_017607 [Aphanomyces stellatus]VFT94419.1 Aste57867_17668 [Aphanomyces stellatus]